MRLLRAIIMFPSIVLENFIEFFKNIYIEEHDAYRGNLEPEDDETS